MTRAGPWWSTYAALGHSNKMIAYELGLAQSTVRVLLVRASTKLGVRGREAALERFRKSCDSENQLADTRRRR